MSKFDIISEKGTNGINCDVSTEDIIDKLNAWDSKYGVTISNVEHDRFDLRLDTIPSDIEDFAKEVYSFCPDIIDQGYGCLDEMVEMMEESGQPIPEEVQKQIDGIDFNDENYGLKILQKVVSEEKMLGFWWD